MEPYSTKPISQSLLEEIAQAIRSVSPYGSVEIYIQNSMVTQITTRNIKKTGQNIGLMNQKRINK